MHYGEHLSHSAATPMKNRLTTVIFFFSSALQHHDKMLPSRPKRPQIASAGFVGNKFHLCRATQKQKSQGRRSGWAGRIKVAATRVKNTGEELRCFIVWVLLCFTGTRTCKKINKKHFRPSAMDLIKYDVIWFYISWHVKNKPFSLVTNLPTFSQSKASINSNHKNTVRTVIRSLHAMCVFWKFSI